jgi:pimeloyl-ACP methyl ester carboxylesterase
LTTFALVHGAGHGAWCWDRVLPRLTARGHRAIAMDLPCEDNSATFSTYADAVIASLARIEGDVILVGHSLGGMTVPLVAARRPVKRMVFLCAVLPIPGALPFGPDLEAPPSTAPGLELEDHEDKTFSFTPGSAASHLYNRCTPDDVRWAIARLRRQSRTPNHEVCSLPAWPNVDRAYVACSDDRIVMPDYARYVARSRAGVDATLMDADHSPFLSTPDALVDMLIQLA